MTDVSDNDALDVYNRFVISLLRFILAASIVVSPGIVLLLLAICALLANSSELREPVLLLAGTCSTVTGSIVILVSILLTGLLISAGRTCRIAITLLWLVVSVPLWTVGRHVTLIVILSEM